MATERMTKEQMLALTFEAELAHKRYWQERFDAYGIEDSPPRMGTGEHFDIAISDFCIRNLPPDTPSKVFGAYKSAVSGLDSDHGPATPEAFVASDVITTRNLLTHCFDIKYRQRKENEIKALEDALRSVYNVPERDFSYIYTLYTKNEDTFWKLILTKALPVFSQQSGPLVNDDMDTTLVIAHEFLIEELIAEDYRPFTPEEYQEFVDSYLKRRILDDEDRLNPFTFVRSADSNNHAN
jgi:hypothetical protein